MNDSRPEDANSRKPEKTVRVEINGHSSPKSQTHAFSINADSRKPGHMNFHANRKKSECSPVCGLGNWRPLLLHVCTRLRTQSHVVLVS